MVDRIIISRNTMIAELTEHIEELEKHAESQAQRIEELERRDSESKTRAEARRQEIKRTRKGFRACEIREAELREMYEKLKEEIATLRTAAREYIEAHKLMRVRFQDSIDATTYTEAGKRLEELLDA